VVQRTLEALLSDSLRSQAPRPGQEDCAVGTEKGKEDM
jgi:hypothetical protein